MSQLVITCPQCGTVYSDGATISGLEFSNNNGPNMTVVCPTCGWDGDLAPADGVYDVTDGRLHLIAEYVAHASLREVEELRAEVELLRRQQNSEESLRFLIERGWAPPSAKSRMESVQNAMNFIIALAAVLALLVSKGGWTAEQAYKLFQEFFN